MRATNAKEKKCLKVFVCEWRPVIISTSCYFSKDRRLLAHITT